MVKLGVEYRHHWIPHVRNLAPVSTEGGYEPPLQLPRLQNSVNIAAFGIFFTARSTVYSRPIGLSIKVKWHESVYTRMPNLTRSAQGIWAYGQDRIKTKLGLTLQQHFGGFCPATG